MLNDEQRKNLDQDLRQLLAKYIPSEFCFYIGIIQKDIEGQTQIGVNLNIPNILNIIWGAMIMLSKYTDDCELFLKELAYMSASVVAEKWPMGNEDETCH